MKPYDPKTPLISIHIPKCGGTSLLTTLKSWFGKKLLPHYNNEKKGQRPKLYKLKSPWTGRYKQGVCVHGHFNKNRQFGVDDYYPEIRQYITFLRDPLEMQLSNFSYVHKRMKRGTVLRDGKPFEITRDIDQYLEETNSAIRLFLPNDLNESNFDEYIDKHFVHLGIIENYQDSLNELADKIGKPRIAVSHENISERIGTPSESSIKKFREKCKFEYRLYEKALAMSDINFDFTLEPKPPVTVNPS